MTISKQKAFTVAELMIVVTIIVILASVSIVVYRGVQARARDTQRRADVQRVADALALYYNRNSNFVETGSGCGYNGDGSGWLTYSNGTTYPRAVTDCLADDGYITGTVSDPSGPNVSSTPTNSNYAYMVYHCGTGSSERAYVFAKLETLPSGSTDPINDPNVCSNTAVDTSYGMNYYVEVK